MNIAAAQSGGPTAAINASLLGVYLGARQQSGIGTVFGVKNGVQGLLKADFIDLEPILQNEKNRTLLRQTPSTFLGSCRVKLPSAETDPEVYERIFSFLEEREIGAFFYIGGNDSMDTVQKLSAYAEEKGSPIRFIGVPKTIDNDLMDTDHTPGFGSAAKYVAATMAEIIRDSSVYSLDSVTIVEIMGRHAGWLTAAPVVLRVNGETAPHLTYLPEVSFSVENFLRDVREVQKTHRAVIVAVSEGVKLDFQDHTDDARHNVLDGFGHVGQLAGVGKTLERVVRRELGCKVRAIELNVMQRCSSHLASLTDLDEAQTVGTAAVKAALQNQTGVMMAFRRVSDDPYRIVVESADLREVANAEKMFPREWINAEGNGVKDDAIRYFLPLIQGEPTVLTKNGLPEHLVLDA